MSTGSTDAGCTGTTGLCALLWELRVTGETGLGTGCTGCYGRYRELLSALGVNWETYGGYWDGDWGAHDVTGEALGFIGGPGVTGEDWQVLEELGWGLGAWRGSLRFRLGVTGEPGGQIVLGGYWGDWNSLRAGMETGYTWVVLGYWEL